MAESCAASGGGPGRRAGCREIGAWADDLLRVAEIEDYPFAFNGLQVDGRRPVARIGAATDACLATIDLAAEAGCDLLMVHHGLFWGGARPLVGPSYERFRRLFESGMGLYSAHLPLDAHPQIGNNILLAAELRVADTEPFGCFKGNDGIGVIGAVDTSLGELAARAEVVCGRTPIVIAGGPESVSRLAIVTGGAGSMIEAAAMAGADTFLTGEGNHHTYHEAMELGINVIYAGHYGTETLGIRTLVKRAAEHFGAEHTFFDVPTGL
ncbi:MAG: Nif3-like dinuclear metal center hexameric protein [Gemmatimonadales bacterium]|nr:Nif3-like dinuclear metal center hexameric protein [Gemmatimonadales bacterium]MYG50720.1 Nif3-like dinuclear metal center hexameric protein [Gemmatimonadales bacterium]MYK02674.1 Nif3-like dinuclear metal center hexameric protein [Candidatus Palauibacter ramosifaciens]